MLSVIIANIWHGTAFSMLNFQSALDNVSGDIEEAARVDGANRVQVLWKIIIPCIKDTIATNIMLNTLSTLGVYGLIYAMTGGGPANKTTTLPIYIWHCNRYADFICGCDLQYPLYKNFRHEGKIGGYIA